MDERQYRLAARVNAYNHAYQVANEIYPKLAAILAPWVGKQVLKANGDLLAKIACMLPDFANPGERVRIVKHPGLLWVVTTWEMNSEHTCTYAEVTVYAGWIENGILTGIAEPQQRRTDYTSAEIEQKRKVYRVAKVAVDDAFKDLGPFGDEDR